MRNASKEKDWLKGAHRLTKDEVNIPAPHFIGLSTERLDVTGSGKYGDSAFRERGLEGNAEGGQEELIDAPNWLVLGVQCLEDEVARGYPAAQAELVSETLKAAAADCYAAWQKIEDAKETFREGRAEAEAVVPAGPPVSHYYED